MRQAQPKPAAPQVAAAKPVVSKETSNPSMTSIPSMTSSSSNSRESGEPSQPSQPSQPSKPAVKLGGIGFSWNNLMDQGKPSKINIIPGTVSPAIAQQKNAQFSQEDLELQWMAMCNRMPQELSGIATRMKNMNPTITELPQIEAHQAGDGGFQRTYRQFTQKRTSERESLFGDCHRGAEGAGEGDDPSRAV